MFLNSSATDIVLVTLPSTAVETAKMRNALVAAQWRGDTALTLPLFWRRSTVSPVFFGRYPRSSLHSSLFGPPPPPPPPPVPNKPSRFCGRKAKCTRYYREEWRHNVKCIGTNDPCNTKQQQKPLVITFKVIYCAELVILIDRGQLRVKCRA